jgi:hypothetical protein
VSSRAPVKIRGLIGALVISIFDQFQLSNSCFEFIPIRFVESIASAFEYPALDSIKLPSNPVLLLSDSFQFVAVRPEDR